METDVALLLGIIVVLILLLLTLLAFLGYSGLFAPIDIKAEKPPFNELKIAYKFSRGSYKNSGALFTEAHSIAPTLKCIGVYYDDPSEVEVPRLRYLVGVVLNDTERPATKEVKEQLEAEGFKTASFPAVDHAVTTVFPFRGSVSVMIAMARVYPKLREYIKEKLLCARPMMEIYEGERVLFVCPLAKQDEFYVEEATEDPEEGATSDPGTTTASEEDHAEDGEDEDEEEEELPSPPTSQPVASNGNGGNGNTEESDHERGSRSSTTSSFEELRLETASN
ncbi:testis-expressed protein 264 homolog [Dermacentor albipictus]|uniref:testis-expressed protein 264 homolog n=1 Tax=Dermacentor albipictus TaxID=60249 RepID=UPI0038FD2165